MGLRRDQRHPLVLSVRISGIDSEGKPFSQASCTLDVNKHGARLYGIRCLKGAGEIITIQYKKNRGRFRVVWVGEPRTPRDGQVGIRNLEPENDVWGLDLPTNQVDDYVRPIPKSGIELHAESVKEATSAIEKLAGLLSAESDKVAGRLPYALEEPAPRPGPVVQVALVEPEPLPPVQVKETKSTTPNASSTGSFEVAGSSLDRLTGHHVPPTSGGYVLDQLGKWFQSNETLTRDEWGTMVEEEIYPQLDPKEKALVQFFQDEDQRVSVVNRNRTTASGDRQRRKSVI